MNKCRRRKARARRKWGRLSADAQIARRHLSEYKRYDYAALEESYLDKLAAETYGIPRNEAESDNEFRARIQKYMRF